ncbi:MAG: TonB-dependent receptor [Pseudomonadota bacterium]|uniref:TonB-dependent receptor n=1 Tax=Phenylobacterium sp. TaxID=1871053 RepID=UPI0025D8F4AC|nr:TonB-dependent receptor [Phenylobacterium sp.]MBT9471123.1 TonB-dependent receptor [Phenylobacterium sp.]
MANSASKQGARARWLAAASTLAFIAASGVATAQDRADNTIDELIVTAQKREQSVQSVPLAITSLGETFLRDRRVADVVDLQNFVPGLNVGRAGNMAKITIRGVSNEFINIGGDAGVAFHLDGIFIGRAEAQLAGIYDVSRVEVLRGPQGTLYGRNATGGSINVVYNRPTSTPEGHVSGSYGAYNEYELEAVASGPLGERAAGRLSLRRQHNDGYTKNAVPGMKALDDKDNFAARGQLLFNLTEDARLLVSADYYRDWSRGGASKFIGGPDGAKTPAELPPYNGQTLVPFDVRDIVANLGQKTYGEFWGVKVELAWSLPAFDFKAISSYRDQNYGFRRAELDGTTLDWSDSNVSNKIWQASQELQLVSSAEGPLQWILGAYYYTENGDQARYIPIFKPSPLALLAGGEVNTDAYALYGHVDYELASRLTLALGARYSVDERKSSDFLAVTGTPLDGTSSGKASWDAATWDATLSYKPAEGAMAYLRVARGFKSGGFNTGSLQQQPFNPEYILSWEAGYKASLFDRRMRLSAVAFYNDYDDLQVTQVQGFSILLTNAASARIKGAELEVSGNVTDALRLNMALGYLDARFRDYQNTDQSRPQKGMQDLSGNRLPNSPEWKLSIGGDYTHELASGGQLRLSGAYYFQDKIYFDAFNEAQQSQGSVGRVDADLSYVSPDGAWRLSLYGKNLTDELVRTAGRVGSSQVGSPNFVLHDPPRTYGVSVRREF